MPIIMEISDKTHHLYRLSQTKPWLLNRHRFNQRCNRLLLLEGLFCRPFSPNVLVLSLSKRLPNSLSSCNIRNLNYCSLQFLQQHSKNLAVAKCCNNKTRQHISFLVKTVEKDKRFSLVGMLLIQLINNSISRLLKKTAHVQIMDTIVLSRSLAS